jgi:hypothetical protein
MSKSLGFLLLAILLLTPLYPIYAEDGSSKKPPATPPRPLQNAINRVENQQTKIASKEAEMQQRMDDRMQRLDDRKEIVASRVANLKDLFAYK